MAQSSPRAHPGLAVPADASVRVVSLPSGTLINSWPYTTGVVPFAEDIALSGSGTMLGQVLINNQNEPAYARQVGPAAGGAPVWSDSLSSQQPIRLSADGRSVGCLANNDILQNMYGSDSVSFLGSKLYAAAGTDLMAVSLPQLGRFGPVQAVGADSLYDPSTNQFYSVATGAATGISNSVPNGVGAVAGKSVVFETGSKLALQPY